MRNGIALLLYQIQHKYPARKMGRFLIFRY